MERREIHALTGIRFFAAAWVVLFHAPLSIVALLPEWRAGAAVVGFGYLAVPVFFALSGYILAYQHYAEFREPAERDYPRFLARRLARIYPLHLVTLASVVVLVLGAAAVGITVKDPDAYTFAGAVQDVFLVRGWVEFSFGWNFPAWSLSAEWFAYLTFPVTVLLVAAMRERRALLLLLMASLAVLRCLGVAWSGRESPHALLDVTTMFVAGVALFVLLRGGRPSAGADLVAFLGLVLLIAAPPFLTGDVAVQGLAMLASLLLIGGLRWGRGPLTWLLAHPWAVWGGRISFALYLTHLPYALVTGRLWQLDVWADQPLIGRLAVAAVWFAGTIAAAALAHYWIEQPGQRLVMRLFEARRTPADPDPLRASER